MQQTKTSERPIESSSYGQIAHMTQLPNTFVQTKELTDDDGIPICFILATASIDNPPIGQGIDDSFDQTMQPLIDKMLTDFIALVQMNKEQVNTKAIHAWLDQIAAQFTKDEQAHNAGIDQDFQHLSAISFSATIATYNEKCHNHNIFLVRVGKHHIISIDPIQVHEMIPSARLNIRRKDGPFREKLYDTWSSSGPSNSVLGKQSVRHYPFNVHKLYSSSAIESQAKLQNPKTMSPFLACNIIPHKDHPDTYIGTLNAPCHLEILMMALAFNLTDSGKTTKLLAQISTELAWLKGNKSIPVNNRVIDIIRSHLDKKAEILAQTAPAFEAMNSAIAIACHLIVGYDMLVESFTNTDTAYNTNIGTLKTVLINTMRTADKNKALGNNQFQTAALLLDAVHKNLAPFYNRSANNTFFQTSNEWSKALRELKPFAKETLRQELNYGVAEFYQNPPDVYLGSNSVATYNTISNVHPEFDHEAQKYTGRWHADYTPAADEMDEQEKWLSLSPADHSRLLAVWNSNSENTLKIDSTTGSGIIHKAWINSLFGRKEKLQRIIDNPPLILSSTTSTWFDLGTTSMKEMAAWMESIERGEIIPEPPGSNITFQSQLMSL